MRIEVEGRRERREDVHPEVECELVLPLAEVEAEDEVEWCAEERELSAKREA